MLPTAVDADSAKAKEEPEAQRTCSNRFASNASLVGAADAHATAGGLSMRSMQTAQSLQQALCWSFRGRARAVREGVAKLPPPKTHLRSKQQQQARVERYSSIKCKRQLRVGLCG